MLSSTEMRSLTGPEILDDCVSHSDSAQISCQLKFLGEIRGAALQAQGVAR